MKINKSEVQRIVLTELAGQGLTRFVPVGVSARHVHLTEEDIAVLFGEGYHLNPIKPLSQPGQFAAREQVTVIGPRGRLEHVRVLGPARKESQVEISVSDSFVLGAKNCPVRLSGDLEGTMGVKLLGPNGQVELKRGLIVAARHLHMNDEQARAYGIHDQQIVNIRVSGDRPCILEGVICRTGSAHELELHLDTDEANSCCLGNGDLAEIVLPGEPVSMDAGNPGAPGSGTGVRVPWNCNGSNPMAAPSMTRRGIDTMESANYRSNNASVLSRKPGAGETVYVSSNPRTLANPGGAHTVEYVSSNARVIENQDLVGRNGYQSNNARAAGDQGSAGYEVYRSGNASVPMNPYGSEQQDIAPSMMPGRAPIPEAWREPTPAQKYEFRPVEKQRQVIEVNEEDILDLVTERNINDAFRDNKTQIYCEPKALITPSAKDRAVAAGIKIIRVKERG